MKYNSSNQPLVCMMTQSTCYKGTKEMKVKGVLWHSTGANNKTVKRYVQPSDNDPNREELLKIIGTNKNGNDWNHKEKQAGVNAFIGTLADGSVAAVQTMPWDFKPWGCGSGSKGSCNDGWIQFEICEDDLKNKEYFEKIYAEACEITAYLCDMFDLDPNGTVDFKGVKVPVILCHADSHDLGLGSNHSDVDHWFSKYNKSMKTVREDVSALMDIIKPEKPYYYRVRKSWDDPASQVGAYTNLDNAKAKADEMGEGYFVFNEEGVAIYPEIPTESNGHKVGDTVRLTADATYSSGANIPQWVKDSLLYVREIRRNGNIVFSTQKTGTITGVTKPENLIAVSEAAPINDPNVISVGDIVYLKPDAVFASGKSIQSWVFKSKLYARQIRDNGEIIISTQQTGAITGVVHKKYLSKQPIPTEVKVQVTATSLRLREGPGTNYKTIGALPKYTTVVIKETKNGWGKTDKGWISLQYTKKV